MQGKLGAFVDFIKERKTVALEDLAAEFGLRVQVTHGQQDRALTSVLAERPWSTLCINLPSGHSFVLFCKSTKASGSSSAAHQLKTAAFRIT